MTEKRILWVALDDSNHANKGPRPEICLGFFSTKVSDSFECQFPKKRDPALISRLQSPYRDYRFLLLSGNEFGVRENNLVATAPSLILDYMKDNLAFDELVILVDGRLTSQDKYSLREELSDYVRNISSKGFIKHYSKDSKNPKIKVYHQPFLLGLADFQAHYLHSKLTLEQLMNHKKRVNLL